MFKIRKFTVEYLEKNCVTDNKLPRFSYALECDENEVELESAILSCNGREKEIKDVRIATYEGEKLKPFSKYEATLKVKTNKGEEAEAKVAFETGFLGTKWVAEWISDPNYQFVEKKVSPIPMVFKKTFAFDKKVKEAKLFITAMGIYDVYLNKKLASDRYFAPGFTSYKTNLQYQQINVTDLLEENNELLVPVAGGWAVGSFIFTRGNRNAADRQALLAELHVEFEDGTNEIIKTDSSWEVTLDGPDREADFYDGETFDARINIDEVKFHQAAKETLKINPTLYAEMGSPVIEHETLHYVSKNKIENGKIIYDFGQNFAGVLVLKIKNGKTGEEIIIKHGEVLLPNGDVNSAILRSAKQTLHYICRDGDQKFKPRFTYMGFRYVSVEGIDEENIDLEARVIYSDIDIIGDFECSNPLLNRLHQNIMWSAKSNFVEIPTDCPQRDERMGWTGDISIFSQTANFNFDMTRFLEKWLKDVQAEQLKTGGLPNTVPANGYGFPATMPAMAIDFWGDAILNVPYQLFVRTGDLSFLTNYYENMQRYVKACKFWAGLLSFGKNKYIWRNISTFHFGDWLTTDIPKMGAWQARHKYTATASLRYTTNLLSEIATILNKPEESKEYKEYSEKVADAYVWKFMEDGKLKGEEFQTGYVLPIQFKMFDEETNKKAVNNLKSLVERRDYCISTGFPGTPYILYALADNGEVETAYKMLLNTKCPSWLYEVKVGGTTIWERWDGLDENGQANCGDDGTHGMISFNHYAAGSVGNFLYTRLVGLEPVEPGYKKFRVKPVLTPEISYAKAKTLAPYGEIKAGWRKENGEFIVDVEVPIGTECDVYLPSGKVETVKNGKYTIKEKLN